MSITTMSESMQGEGLHVRMSQMKYLIFFEMVLKKLLNEKHSNQPELNEVKSLYKEYWFEVRSKTRYNNVKEFIEDIICNNEENLFNLKSF